MNQAEGEFMLKISMEFTARAMQRCSKACITNIKTPVPTEAEKMCIETCIAKHTRLFGEGLSIITKAGNQQQ